jgi:hypothetical protein
MHSMDGEMKPVKSGPHKIYRRSRYL